MDIHLQQVSSVLILELQLNFFGLPTIKDVKYHKCIYSNIVNYTFIHLNLDFGIIIRVIEFHCFHLCWVCILLTSVCFIIPFTYCLILLSRGICFFFFFSWMRNLWFVMVLTKIKQCFWCDVIYYLRQTRFNCPSTVSKKYVHWFNIMHIVVHHFHLGMSFLSITWLFKTRWMKISAGPVSSNCGGISAWSMVMKCLHIILILFVHCFYLLCEIKSYHSLTSCNIISGFFIFFLLNLTKKRLFDYTIVTHRKTSISRNFDFHKTYFQ